MCIACFKYFATKIALISFARRKFPVFSPKTTFSIQKLSCSPSFWASFVTICAKITAGGSAGRAASSLRDGVRRASLRRGLLRRGGAVGSAYPSRRPRLTSAHSVIGEPFSAAATTGVLHAPDFSPRQPATRSELSPHGGEHEIFCACIKPCGGERISTSELSSRHDRKHPV